METRAILNGLADVRREIEGVRTDLSNLESARVRRQNEFTRDLVRWTVWVVTPIIIISWLLDWLR
jgi:hypothetical protein